MPLLGYDLTDRGKDAVRMKRKQAVKRFMFVAILNRVLLKNNRLKGEIGQAMQLILLMPMPMQAFLTLYRRPQLYCLSIVSIDGK